MNFAPFRFCAFLAALLPGAVPLYAEAAGETKLFDNLQTLGTSLNVDDQGQQSLSGTEGPKGLAAADFDGDGFTDLVAANHDGTLAVLFAKEGGGFEPALYLRAGSPRGLRDVITADTNGDGTPDIAAAHPFDGKIYIFHSTGRGSRTGQPFEEVMAVTTWTGARGLAAGDFNGDGKMDLAAGGAGDGVRELRGDGAGVFTAQAPVTGIVPGPAVFVDGGLGSARPVFAMQAWRAAGESRDRLAVTYAGAARVWLLESAGDDAPLAVKTVVPLMRKESVYDLTLGYITAEARATGEPDLITAATWSGEIYIRRHQGTGATAPYTLHPQVRLPVAGGPRALSLADVNGDGWTDLFAVSRSGNTVSVFLNENGVLRLHARAPAGDSPRDVTSLDVNGDGKPDAAVINLDSRDVTLHPVDPLSGRFLQSPLAQWIPGGAACLKIADMDADLRDELLLLNGATGELSLCRLGENQQWLTPARYQMGARPQTLLTPDINGDGKPDLLCASLGNWMTPPALIWRLQQTSGTFGPAESMPAPARGLPPFKAIVAEDFDGDGRMDIAAAAHTARQLYLFQGTAGGFALRAAVDVPLVIHALTAGDIDGDGDKDLAGTDDFGGLTVVENSGSWFTGAVNGVHTFESSGRPGAYAVTITARSGATGRNFIVLAREAVTVWSGNGTVPSGQKTDTLPPTLGAVTADWDGDGAPDWMALSPSVTTAAFYPGSQIADGQWWKAPPAKFMVPSSRMLAAGDLDGDGRPDLAGAGEYLWVALSGTPAPPPVSLALDPPPPGTGGVVINEILTTHDRFIPPGAGASVDCVEIYNGSAETVDLTEWRLRLIKPESAGQEAIPDFLFPPHSLAPGERQIIYCTERSGLWQAPFKLPSEGATLRLFDAGEVLRDEVACPLLFEDVSFARLSDGSPHFVYSPLPGIGSPNGDQGNVEPRVSLMEMDPVLLAEGRWRFLARGWDDNGICSLTLHWKRLGTPLTGVVRLYDDGRHGDGAASDGVFAGEIPEIIPAGTALEFYLTGVDRNWQRATEPESPEFTPAGQPVQNYSLNVLPPADGWEIAEVVSRNHSGLLDDSGISHDWLELRYTAQEPPLEQGFVLSEKLFGFKQDELYDLSRLGKSALPGAMHVVFLTGMQDSGANPNYAPFAVNGEGDRVYLFRRSPAGVTELVDWLAVPALPPDIAWARLGVRGPFFKLPPTPLQANAPPEGTLFFTGPDGRSGDVVFAFSGPGTGETSSGLQAWTVILPAPAAPLFERMWREPPADRNFFRVR